MIWRAGTQFVVARDDGYWVVDATGTVIERHAPTEWSLEDELGRTRFEVAGGVLREHTEIDRGPHELRRTDRVVLDGLVADDDPETARFVATVLGDDRVRQEERRLQVAQVADARVAAIAGARDDHGLGDDFARAQRALVDRVHAYDDRLAAALLRTLIDLARARVSGAAIAAYVRGCLCACFAYGVPDLAGTATVPAPFPEALAALARALDAAADRQELVDATANARAYWAAAEAVRAAYGGA